MMSDFTVKLWQYTMGFCFYSCVNHCIVIFFFNFTILYWFCHISKWTHHRYTCVPHPEPSSLPIPSLWVVPVRQPQASSIVRQTWTGDSYHIWYYTCFSAILPDHPTLSLSHRDQKTVLYISVLKDGNNNLTLYTRQHSHVLKWCDHLHFWKIKLTLFLKIVVRTIPASRLLQNMKCRSLLWNVKSMSIP